MTSPDPRGGAYRDSALRPYVLTKGRGRPSRNTIGMDTLVIATDPAPSLPLSAGRQERALLAMCRGLLSLVEVAARLELPVSVVRVLASDLVDSGHLTARAGSPGAAQPSRELLQEVLNGLRAL
ncbi:DUF742 domain-containing protein [Plantactinospora soyae]|uniref:DUF742 domain-containing protein n=1 Tax=Plantactinospora soyae TaxID=1544732 RepID=A0A927M2S9_9ACTN|nr:DUF742 domain-containing protein [Plantactinospora soyae]MBE1486589.1 hypothetical protein [Plantactinospora soyae]